jgi:hypothetical protein
MPKIVATKKDDWNPGSTEEQLGAVLVAATRRCDDLPHVCGHAVRVSMCCIFVQHAYCRTATPSLI